MFIKYWLSHHPQDHPCQWYGDLLIPLLSLKFKKVRGGGGGTYSWGRLPDIMAKGVGAYSGEGAYSRKNGIHYFKVNFLFLVSSNIMFTHQVGSAKEKLHSSLCCRAGHWRTCFIQHHKYKHVKGLTVKWYVILFGHWTNKVSNAVLLRKKYITDSLDQTIGVHFIGVMQIRISYPK